MIKSLWSEPNEARTSHSRLLALGAFIVTSWVIIRMELREATSYELVIGYLTVMITGEVWKRVSMNGQRTTLDKAKIDASFKNVD